MFSSRNSFLVGLLLTLSFTGFLCDDDDYLPEGYNNNYDDDNWDDPMADEEDVKTWKFMGKNLGFWIAYVLFFVGLCLIPFCILVFMITAVCIDKDWELPAEELPRMECVFCGKAFKSEERIEWKNHRKTCIQKNEEIYATWQRPYDYRCGKCEQRVLRLVPSNDEIDATASAGITSNRRFKCQGEKCNFKYLRNRGHNRFTCYECDYNKCRTCLRKELGVYLHPKQA